MKMTYTFVKSSGSVKCSLPTGKEIEVPVVQGILKHLTTDSLRGFLKNPDAARKYTIEALRKAPWPVLRQFPHGWLRDCIEDAHLEPRRSRALAFMLSSRRVKPDHG